ncbi:MAG: DegT/DnrJ/EryC1/StrS family aminotransferase, partial [Melioribacteraceae bacterium]|nr:DegT/DnrJ/EryC1/StrS family aminotransferase [Melioribacteraceae bacterium]
IGQLEKIEELLSQRQKLANNYNTLLTGIKGVKLPEITPNGIHSYQSYCIFIEDQDRIMNTMRTAGIEVQIGTYALHKHKAFADGEFIKNTGKYPNSVYAYEHCLALPLYNDLDFQTQEYIVNKLANLL